MSSQKKDLVKVEIISDWDGVSNDFFLGVKFSISPGWYIYWQNPGDAGLAPEIKLTLPTRLKAGEVLFPVPRKITHGDIISFGYYNEVVLLIPVQIVSKEKLDRSSIIDAKINWLVCSESCVPGSTTIKYALRKAKNTERALIKKYKNLVPRNFESSGLVVKNFKVERKGNLSLIKIEFTGNRAAQVVDFYPNLIKEFLIDLKSVKVKNGIVELTVTPSSADAELNFLNGVIVINGDSYGLHLQIQ
ncbi:MAG: protein-disulfide reductase DsbD domain-containing protein [Candidatus Kryptonium sp.]